MRIDCSEPEECGCVVVTCYHCRTSGMLNTQESGPSNVIASSVTSMPASSRPVQALGHDSAAIGSTSASSPVLCSSPIRSGALTSLAPPDITSVSSEPTQSVGPNNLGSGASAAPTSSTESPGHSSSPSRFVFSPSATSVSSASIQAVGPTSFASMQTPASIFGSRQAPDCDSCGIFGAPKSSIFAAPTPSTSVVTSVRSAFDFPSPFQTENCDSTSTSSPLHRIRFETTTQSPPAAITSVSSGPAFGSAAFGAPTPSTFGSTQAPAFGSAAFGAPTQPIFGSTQAPAFGSGAFGAPTQPIFGSTQAPAFGSGASAAPTPSTASPGHISSPTSFVMAPSATLVSSAPTQSLVTSVSSAFAGPSPPLFGSMQAPVQASAPNTSTSFSFGDFGKTASTFARPDFGFSPAINPPPTTTVVFGTTPCNVSSLFGPTQDFAKTSSVFASSTTPKNPFIGLFPGFGVDYLPGSPSNVFGPNPPTTTPVSSGFKTSQPFGFNGPAPTFSSNNTIGSRYPRYAPTPDDCDFRGHRNMMSSIAASNAYQHKSHEELRWEDYKLGDKGGGGFFPAAYITPMGSRPNPYQHKSHEELRWEDYKQGDKGGAGLFPAAHISPGSRPNAFFSPSTALPSIFAHPSIPDHPQRTGFVYGVPAAGETISSSNRFDQTSAAFNNFGSPSSSSTSSTTFPVAAPISSSVAVSSPASGCSACGATSSSSASGFSGFNVATTPPLAATSLPGLFFSTAGSSCPMLFGTTNFAAQGTTTTPAPQALMMFGTNLAAQGTIPAVQVYPVHGLILLPFAAMNLQ